MWIFTRYGFYSIACAENLPPLKVPCSYRVTIRARRRQHLLSLQTRFPELKSKDIEETPERDYAYRMTVAKRLWISLLTELAGEQTWSNFKQEVHDFQGAGGSAYCNSLHQIWGVMKQFQMSAPVEQGQNKAAKADIEPTAYWDGIIDVDTLKDNNVRNQLASSAKKYDWATVFQILAEHPELVNATRPGGQSLYAPLHQAAHAGEWDVADQLIEIGAWRTLRNAKGERPVDVARNSGHVETVDFLNPIYKRRVPEAILATLQDRFHSLIREVVQKYCRLSLRLPELEPLLEFEQRHFWFEVPGMYGGFHYWLLGDGPEARLIVQSWSRVGAASGLWHDITAQKTTLIDEGFV